MQEYMAGHRERLRIRAEEIGIDNLRDYEVLELILCYAVPRMDMSSMSRNLISRFGSVKNVFSASREDLMSIAGVGKSVADWIFITGELINSYESMEPAKQNRIVRHLDAIRYVLSNAPAITPPKCMVIYTDFNKRVLMKTILCDSLSWYHPEYMRRIITESIALQAKHVILVLYTGPVVVDFGKSDVDGLLNLSRSLRAIDVELIDCILSGENGVQSLNACGAMDMIRGETKNTALHEDYVKVSDE